MSSVTAAWMDDSQTIIHIVFEEGWDWDALTALYDILNTMLDGVDHQVVIIGDLRAARTVPDGMMGHLNEIRRMPGLTHPNAGLAVIVGGSSIHRMLLDALCAFFPAIRERLLLADTVEEAQALIAERRVS